MDRSRADAPPDEAVPQQLGEFQILRVLGTGGSGVVYAARWGHREVALKVLRDNLVTTDSERGRFFKEAQSLSEIKHPSVVKVLSFGDLPDGRPYLVMELLDGQTLANRLSHGPFPVGPALGLFDQLVGAVDAMHQHGLVHRDLKPENIVLVTGDEFLVLLDFGIAKELDAQPSTVTQEGGIRGTPAYMAPERFFGQPASQATDVYELAVTLYVMLVGRLPWDSAADPNARLDPKRPSELGVVLPGDLEAQLHRALSTRPEVRPDSAVALSRAVRAAANLPAAPIARATVPVSSSETPAQRPDTLASASTVAETTRTSRRTWLVVAGAVLLVALSATLAFVLWPKADKAPAPDIEPVGEGAGVVTADDEPKEPTPEPSRTVRREADDSVFFEAPKFHPSDTLILMGLRARELRHSSALESLFETAKDNAYAKVANAYVSACDIDLFEDIDWLTLGVSGAKRDQVEVMVSGEWKRAQIDGCVGELISGFGLGEPEKVEPDGDLTRLVLEGHDIFVGWIDDRTAMISLRDGADAKWMRARLARQGSVADGGLLSSSVARLDTRATFWLAGESDDELAADVLGDLTPPELVWLSLGISSDITLSGGAVFSTSEQAGAAEKEFDSWKQKVVASEPVYDMFLRTVKLRADKTRLLLEAAIDKGLTMLVVKGLESELRKSMP